MMNAFVYTDDMQQNLELFEYIYHSKILNFRGSSNSLIETLLVFFSSRKPDVIFIDMETKSDEWQVLFQGLRSAILIVLVSSHTRSPGVLEIGNVLCLGKPFKYEHFLACETIFQRKTAEQHVEATTHQLIPQFFFIQSENKGQHIKINISEIIFIEANSNYLTIIHINGQHVCYLRLMDMENKLPKERFVRIHKSFIINIEKIKAIKFKKVLLENGIVLPIGNTYKDSFMNLIRTKIVKAVHLIGGLVSVFSSLLFDFASVNDLWLAAY